MYCGAVDTIKTTPQPDPQETQPKITKIEQLQNGAWVVALRDPAEVFIINATNTSMWLGLPGQTQEYHLPHYLSQPVDCESLLQLKFERGDIELLRRLVGANTRDINQGA